MLNEKICQNLSKYLALLFRHMAITKNYFDMGAMGCYFEDKWSDERINNHNGFADNLHDLWRTNKYIRYRTTDRRYQSKECELCPDLYQLDMD